MFVNTSCFKTIYHCFGTMEKTRITTLYQAAAYITFWVLFVKLLPFKLAIAFSTFSTHTSSKPSHPLVRFYYLWRCWESNPGLTYFHKSINKNYVVVPLGLEPRTPWLWVRCSNQLSYRTCLPEAFAKIILKFVICKCLRCIFSWLRHSNTHVEHNSKCKIIESVWRSNFFESQS